MNKNEFLKQLKKNLRLLPAQERQKVLDYYSEMIEDEIEEGRSEVDAVSRRGNAAEIAKQTVREYFSARDDGISENEQIKSTSNGLAKRLTITILSFPLWLPLYAAGWSILTSLFAAAFSCALAGVACLIPSIILIVTDGAAGVFQCGMCMAALGCGIVLGYGSWELTKLWLKMSGWLCRGIRYSFGVAGRRL